MIQRLLVGATLVYTGLTYARSMHLGVSFVLETMAAVGGVFLVFGLWTPVAGSLTALLQAWIAATSSADPFIPVLLAIFAATLAMIGPGAWSMDARLFGRKHIVPHDLLDFPPKL